MWKRRSKLNLLVLCCVSSLARCDKAEDDNILSNEIDDSPISSTRSSSIVFPTTTVLPPRIVLGEEALSNDSSKDYVYISRNASEDVRQSQPTTTTSQSTLSSSVSPTSGTDGLQ